MSFGEWRYTHEGVRCVAVDGHAALFGLCGEVRRRPAGSVVAFDTETDGLTHDRRLVLFQVGWDDQVWLVKPDDAGRVFSAMLQGEATLVAHNLSFDLLTMCIFDSTFVEGVQRVLRESPGRFLCTLTFSKCVFGGAAWVRHGLNHVARRFGCYVESDERLSTRALRSETAESGTLFFQHPLDDHDFLWYAASDVIMLLSICGELEARASDRQRLLATFETVFAVLAGFMCQRGMRLDLEKLDRFRGVLESESARLLSGLNERFGVQLKSWHDRRGLAAAIRKFGGVFDEDDVDFGGYALVDRVDTPKTNKKVLRDLRRRDGCSERLARFITEYLAGQGAVSDATKIPGYKLLATGDGVLHADFKPLGTVTGRTSCNKPNLQNVRKRGELSPRKLFIPRDGFRLASCDFSGIEVRVLAWLAQDGVLAGHIRDGFDMHQAMADVIGADRFTAKCAVFGMLYGEGVQSRSENYSLSLAQSEAVAERFRQVYVRSGLWLDGAMNHARAELETVDGVDSFLEVGTGWRCNMRKHREGGWLSYLAANYHIQGWAAHFLKRAALRLFGAGLWRFCVMSVHDEFIFEFPAGDAERLLGDAMEACTLTVDVQGEPFRFELDGEVFESFWGS